MEGQNPRTNSHAVISTSTWMKLASNSLLSEAFRCLDKTGKIGLWGTQRYCANRRFPNKCNILEEPNSSGKIGIRVKFFSIITGNVFFNNPTELAGKIYPAQTSKMQQKVSLSLQ